VAQATRLRRKPQAGASTDASDGLGGDLSAQADERPLPSTSHLTLFIAKSNHRAALPGVERGHHVCAAVAGLHVTGGGA
jgi:hypothetical protein